MRRASAPTRYWPRSAARLPSAQERHRRICVSEPFNETRRSPPMPLTGLNHYLVVSKNLERSKKFYQEVLGMQLAERPDFGFPGYWLKLGEDICVHLASQDPNQIRDTFLLKKHPKGTTGSGS